MGDGTESKISDLRQGDQVWNPRTERAHTVIRVVRGPEKIPMYEIKTDTSTVLVTHGHPFLTPAGILTARQLTGGMELAEGKGWVKVQSVRMVPVSEPAPIVWNIEVSGGADDDDHFVLANGIMTGDLYLQEHAAQKMKAHGESHGRVSAFYVSF